MVEWLSNEDRTAAIGVEEDVKITILQRMSKEKYMLSGLVCSITAFRKRAVRR